MENLNAEHIANVLEVEIGFSDGKFTKIEVSVLKDALALITSQEQRIKELEAENRQYDYEQRKLVEAHDTYKEYAENMQLFVEKMVHLEDKGYEPSAARYAAEMDMWRVVALEKQKLTEENEKIGIENFNLICELSRIKADTVRKMQERIGEYFVEHNEIKYGGGLIHKVIDQIAKELLEGDNG